MSCPRDERYPLGARVTVTQLERDPHPVLASLREHEPVSWIPALDGWLVTRYDLAVAAMRDPETFTVDDRRFSTAQVVGPSMLSLDGAEHARHRAPFSGPFRPGAVTARFGEAVVEEAERLILDLTRRTEGELRRGFAGPLAAATITRALGLERGEVPTVLVWYDGIVASVNEITAGSPPTGPGSPRTGAAAYTQLSQRLRRAIDGPASGSLLAAASAHGDSDLTPEQIASNAAVLLFGGIETTEGMIAGALLHLLQRPEHLRAVREQPELLDSAIEESLRLEPAAAVIDRYATRDANLGGAEVRGGELIRVSIAAANRDPRVFEQPDEYRLNRNGARRHLAFAHGPHVCVGVHLARLEARVGLSMLIEALPGLRLDPARPSEFRGLVFRKPVELNARWD